MLLIIAGRNFVMVNDGTKRSIDFYQVIAVADWVGDVTWLWRMISEITTGKE
jgi:hypothetical protein